MYDPENLTLEDVCVAHFERRVDCVAVSNNYISQRRTKQDEWSDLVFDIVKDASAKGCERPLGGCDGRTRDWCSSCRAELWLARDQMRRLSQTVE